MKNNKLKTEMRKQLEQAAAIFTKSGRVSDLHALHLLRILPVICMDYDNRKMFNGNPIEFESFCVGVFGKETDMIRHFFIKNPPPIIHSWSLSRAEHLEVKSGLYEEHLLHWVNSQDKLRAESSALNSRDVNTARLAAAALTGFGLTDTVDPDDYQKEAWKKAFSNFLNLSIKMPPEFEEISPDVDVDVVLFDETIGHDIESEVDGLLDLSINISAKGVDDLMKQAAKVGAIDADKDLVAQSMEDTVRASTKGTVYKVDRHNLKIYRKDNFTGEVMPIPKAFLNKFGPWWLFDDAIAEYCTNPEKPAFNWIFVDFELAHNVLVNSLGFELKRLIKAFNHNEQNGNHFEHIDLSRRAAAIREKIRIISDGNWWKGTHGTGHAEDWPY